MVRPKNKPNPRRAIAYVRVSTDRQELGPEAQRAAIESWSARERVRVVGWFEDRLSGATPLDERPGLLGALSALGEHGAALLVVAKRDRLARDPVVGAMVEAAARHEGARVVSAAGEGNDDTPEGEMMRGIVDVFARFERARIRQRTREALAAKRAKGEPVGRAPFGFRWSAGALEPEPDEQRTIERIKSLRAEGRTVRAIVDLLNSEGTTARNGAKWSPTTVHRVIARSAPSPTKRKRRTRDEDPDDAPALELDPNAPEWARAIVAAR